MHHLVAILWQCIAVSALPATWQTGTATFYGDGGSGGHCGGADLGDYGKGDSWINGLYVATSSHMWCGQTRACGNTHASDCGRCYEVRCTGTDTNTDGYEPCLASATVTVAVTDECPGGGHCSGKVSHFDLSTLAFKTIGNTRAGVIHIEFRQVSCKPGTNLKLAIKSGSTQWWLEVAPKDVAGFGSVRKMEVHTAALGAWTELEAIYGQFWKYSSDIGEGPYSFRITAEDGQRLEYTTEGTQLPTGDIDIGTNFAAGSGTNANTSASSSGSTGSSVGTGTADVKVSSHATLRGAKLAAALIWVHLTAFLFCRWVPS